MGKNYFFKLLLVIISAFAMPNLVSAQLYPDFEKQVPRKKKQKEIPRFPPQFHSRDTTAAVRDSIAKTKLATATSKEAPKTVYKAPAPRTDSFVRIISKKTDVNGNTYIEQETVVGNKKTRQTIVVGGISLNKPFDPDTIDKDSVTIQVIKKNYRVYVYHKHRFLTAYKCVFGPDYMEQKQKEGDRRTPEGWFKILQVRPHKEWNTFMLLDYPNEECYKNFEANIQNGVLSKTCKIGGAIGIHGVWEDADKVVDDKRNWTDGCISMKIADLEQLKKIVKVGTPIFITKVATKNKM